MIKLFKKNEITISVSSSSELNQREMSLLQHNIIKGIANIEVKEKRKKVDLIVSTENRITLEQFMQSTVDQNVFFKLVKNIVSILVNSFDKMLRTDNFDLNFKRILINEASKSVELVYWPTMQAQGANDMHHFFMVLLNQSKISGGNEKDMLSVIEYLTQNKIFSLKNFAKILSSIKGGGQLDIDSGQFTSTALTSSKKLSDISTTSPDPSGDIFRYVPEKSNPIKQTDATSQIIQDNSETTILGEATTILGSVEVSKNTITLTQTKTGTVSTLMNDSMKIGKVGDVSILDNSAISRNHAEIYFENNNYYIADLDSTNGTHVNDLRIMVPTIIVNGDRIKLADELFIFKVMSND